MPVRGIFIALQACINKNNLGFLGGNLKSLTSAKIFHQAKGSRQRAFFSAFFAYLNIYYNTYI